MRIDKLCFGLLIQGVPSVSKKIHHGSRTATDVRNRRVYIACGERRRSSLSRTFFVWLVLGRFLRKKVQDDISWLEVLVRLRVHLPSERMDERDFHLATLIET